MASTISFVVLVALYLLAILSQMEQFKKKATIITCGDNKCKGDNKTEKQELYTRLIYTSHGY